MRERTETDLLTRAREIALKLEVGFRPNLQIGLLIDQATTAIAEGLADALNAQRDTEKDAARSASPPQILDELVSRALGRCASERTPDDTVIDGLCDACAVHLAQAVYDRAVHETREQDAKIAEEVVHTKRHQMPYEVGMEIAAAIRAAASPEREP